MAKTIYFPKLDLQLFAEGGGDGGTGAEGATGVSAIAAVSHTKGVKSNPLADVVYGKHPVTTEAVEEASSAAEVIATPTEDRNAKFEELIKGEYKDLYDAKVQDIVRKRVRTMEDTVNKHNALAPTLEMLAKKYGVDANNVEALNKAIEEDDAYYEEEALDKGISVEQLKEIRKMERENAELKRTVQERERRDAQSKQYAQWMKQAEEAKRTYPSLDLATEVKDPQFLKLLGAGIDVGTAYSVIHKDEIIPAAMQYAAKTVEQKISNKVIAGGARPVENGISSQSATVTKSDVSQLTKADRAEINRRVARGDKITFG